MLHRRINDLETAVTGLLRGPYQRTSSMAVTFACLVMGHPSKHDDEDAGCFCTIRKAP
jgi:hypothetical protein